MIVHIYVLPLSFIRNVIFNHFWRLWGTKNLYSSAEGWDVFSMKCLWMNSMICNLTLQDEESTQFISGCVYHLQVLQMKWVGSHWYPFPWIWVSHVKWRLRLPATLRRIQHTKRICHRRANQRKRDPWPCFTERWVSVWGSHALLLVVAMLKLASLCSFRHLSVFTYLSFGLSSSYVLGRRREEMSSVAEKPIFPLPLPMRCFMFFFFLLISSFYK